MADILIRDARCRLNGRKGQSGNPKGRPRKQPITTELERTGNSPCPPSIRRLLAKLGIKLEERATWNEALVCALYHKAVTSSDVGVAREILDRLESKLRPQLEEEDDEPGNINVMFVTLAREMTNTSVARRPVPLRTRNERDRDIFHSFFTVLLLR